MTDYIKSDHDLNKLVESYGQEIISDCDNVDDMYDLAIEYADGSEHVIYYGKAHSICQNCNVEEGESFVYETDGFGRRDTYDSMATKIAYGEIWARLQNYINDHAE